MTLRYLLALMGAYFLLILAEQPLPARAEGDWRYGLIESYESPREATTAGATWTRVRFQWAEVQAGGADTWTPQVTDQQIKGEIDAGRLVTGMLIGIPDWARDDDLLPAGLWLPHTDPDNSWAVFVREAVSRYRGRIDHWIIWNEPDVWDASAPGHTWDGSEEDFAQLLRIAYKVAKETNPNAVIHLAAMTYFWDYNFNREQYLDRLFKVITADPEAKAHHYYFDVLTAHLYFQPQTIFDVIQEFNNIRLANSIPWKPIWLVETNAPPIDDSTWPVSNWTLKVTLNEQAAFIPQALAVALAAGAERIAVYKLKDTADDRAANPEPFGLLRMDGSRRPAFTTYQMAVQYLSGVTSATRERWDHVGQIRLTQPGRTTTVLFSRLPAGQQAQVVATAATATLVDMWGEKQTITSSNGVFSVDLPGSSCSQSIGDYCMIGGPTFYLLQSTTGASAPPGAGGEIDHLDPNIVMSTITSTPTPTKTTDPTITPRATNTSLPATMTAESPSMTANPQPNSAPTSTATSAATPSRGQADPAGTRGIWMVGVLGLVTFLLAAGWLFVRHRGS